MSNFGYNSKTFLLDGEPFTVISGTIHYFRHVPQYWRDRLRKLRQCGFNTVETYVCWNLHERAEGSFDFGGRLDLGAFLDIAAEEGLKAIVRPGPYICAEWDFGGLPAWLLNHRNMRVRCMDEEFLFYEKRYLSAVFDILRPRLVTCGGNVIMLQVENEYGSYGNDHEYIDHLADFFRESGINVPLFTSDGPSVNCLSGGTSEKLLATLNFGSNPKGSFGLLKEFRPNQPMMCSEFWEGWFDVWYGPHRRREPDDVAAVFDEILSMGANVNFYMFCGGTNFAFTNGANCDVNYTPQTTSYDYDAMLTENGDLTQRFFEVREVVGKHFGNLPELTVGNLPRRGYGDIRLSESAPLFSNLAALSKPVTSSYPLTMEELGADFGFALYSAEVCGPVCGELDLDPLRDRAMFFLNGSYAGTKERSGRNDTVRVETPAGTKVRVDVLVENLGRINYGVHMSDNRKGLINSVRIDQQHIFGWTMYPLTMDDLSALSFGAAAESGGCPAFLRGYLDIGGEPEDTFIRLDGFHKGFVTVNGFNIGRYWNDAGPQKTLYLPAPLLKKGRNEIIVFELHGFEENRIESVDTPDLG